MPKLTQIIVKRKANYYLENEVSLVIEMQKEDTIVDAEKIANEIFDSVQQKQSEFFSQNLARPQQLLKEKKKWKRP